MNIVLFYCFIGLFDWLPSHEAEFFTTERHAVNLATGLHLAPLFVWLVSKDHRDASVRTSIPKYGFERHAESACIHSLKSLSLSSATSAQLRIRTTGMRLKSPMHVYSLIRTWIVIQVKVQSRTRVSPSILWSISISAASRVNAACYIRCAGRNANPFVHCTDNVYIDRGAIRRCRLYTSNLQIYATPRMQSLSLRGNTRGRVSEWSAGKLLALLVSIQCRRLRVHMRTRGQRGDLSQVTCGVVFIWSAMNSPKAPTDDVHK